MNRKDDCEAGFETDWLEQAHDALKLLDNARPSYKPMWFTHSGVGWNLRCEGRRNNVQCPEEIEPGEKYFYWYGQAFAVGCGHAAEAEQHAASHGDGDCGCGS